MSEPVMRDLPKEGEQRKEPDHACEGSIDCNDPANYRIHFYKLVTKRRTKHDLYLCDFHFSRFQLEKHKFAYTITMLKPE
jgi:hypothetical protein